METLLREKIVSGDFEPGTHLKESDIAKQAKVSRASVREAIRLLEKSGLVIQKPRRGFFVALPSPEEIAELYEYRVCIESWAVTKFMKAPKRELIDDLHEACAGIRDCNTIQEKIRADLSFHSKIVGLGQNGYASKQYENVAWQLRFLFSFAYGFWVSGYIDADHEKLVQYISVGDQIGFERALQSHTTESWYIMQKSYSKRYFPLENA